MSDIDLTKLVLTDRPALLETKRRIVFKSGRDLNIFNVVAVNLDGQWWRITDDMGRLYIVNPSEVNYVEVK